MERSSGPARTRARASARALSLLACVCTACDPAAGAARSDAAVPGPQEQAQAAPPADVPAWLAMTPNFRREESSRLASAAILQCNERLHLAELRARLDSVRRRLGLEPQETRSHPEASRALDALLERQNERQACLETSDLYRESRGIVEQTPAHFELPVYAAPDSASDLVGIIRIRGAADQPGPPRLVFTYRAADEEKDTPWTLDRMQVGGYGGYFHTVLERRDGWLLLPADPFPDPAWIHWSGTFRSPPGIEPVFGGVYMMRDVEANAAGMEVSTSPDAPGVVYERSDGRRVWFRLERPADGPCPELRQPRGRALPRPEPGLEWSIPLEDLLDEQRHLAVRVKYRRGC